MLWFSELFAAANVFLPNIFAIWPQSSDYISFPFSIFILTESCCRWSSNSLFLFYFNGVMLSLKLKSFPFSIFILGHAVLSSSHSLFSIFYFNGSVAELKSFLVCRFQHDKVYHVVILRSQIYCTKVKTLDVINFK
jgi:hypothetical protein